MNTLVAESKNLRHKEDINVASITLIRSPYNFLGGTQVEKSSFLKDGILN